MKSHKEGKKIANNMYTLIPIYIVTIKRNHIFIVSHQYPHNSLQQNNLASSKLNNKMKKFGFGPIFIIMILLCGVLALTSYTASASEISHNATMNKLSNGTVQKQNYIFEHQKAVIHRRARPNNSSAQSLNKHPFFVFASIISLFLVDFVLRY